MRGRSTGLASAAFGCAACLLLWSAFMWGHWLYGRLRAADIGAPAYKGPLMLPHERLTATVEFLERTSVGLAAVAAAIGLGLGIWAVSRRPDALGVVGIVLSFIAWLGLGCILVLLFLAMR
jgi:hypothetical protein